MLVDIQKSKRSRQKLLDMPCYKEQMSFSDSEDDLEGFNYRDQDDVSFLSDHNHNSESGADYGTFLHDNQDDCHQLTTRLREHLLTAPCDLELYAPCNLLERTAQEVVNASTTEPYGLKGCVLHVNLQRKNVCHKLGKIVCDPDTVTTFELFLTLEESVKVWHGVSDLLLTFVSRCFNEKAVYLSPSFSLSKHKLYRSNSSDSSSIHSS